MPTGKRKIEFFDPNKSDSDDVDYVSGQDRPRKSAKRARTQSKRSAGTKRRRTKYGGSDDSDDEVGNSVSEDSLSEEDEVEDEVEMDPTTGRGKRKAKAKVGNYAESSDDSDEPEKDSDDEELPPAKRAKPSKIVKLRVLTTGATTRTTRAGSAAATRGRGRTSTEPISAGATRRNTRAHTEEGEDMVALSASGRHVEVIRSSRSPESAARARPTRGSKGLKKPASMIKEEEHESSSYAQPEVEGDTAVESDVMEVTQEEPQVIEVSSKENTDSHQEPSYDELAGENVEFLPAAEADTGDDGEDGEDDKDDGDDEDDEDDEDAVPITRGGRTRAGRAGISAAVEEAAEEETPVAQRASRRLTRNASSRKGGQEQSSDFEPVEESGEEDPSASDGSPQKGKGSDDTDGTPRRGRSAAQGKSKSSRSSRRRATAPSDDEEELDQEELIEEVQELKAGRRGNRQRLIRDSDILYERDRRTRKPVDYTIKPMEQIYAADEDADDITATPSRGGRGRRNGASQAWERNLYTTYGPFGGAGGPGALIGGPWGTGAAGGADSDSSDDENMQRPNIGGNVGMTPTSAMPPGLLPGIGQTHTTDAVAALGTPANFGKVKSQKALADADPLGVDQNVDFSKVGGLAGHIDQLKEMVQMPLLYPELFMKFHVTPPRGVLFHGPPGTGKTLLARALAASVGSGGRKITFYMRKGADALSKWVGEAERQLRLLFEEARKTQPSIIFFDEIDGLAPVRSSKQEQIHASIVSTLLALMDGMDGRGQVIVIGATNRPDNIDPALRRPGRFDREFYFPLPDFDGRLSIINIHTTDWGIDEAFKGSLAHATKGYGGADLRALCTEAALNAIQRTYPQIYSSNEKLIVDPDKIKITAKDFMISIKKMVPSSERATSSGAAPLPKVVEPLLRDQLKSIERIIDGLIPIKKKITALQEAMYEQYEDADQGFGRETLQQEFEKSRVFRPRLLIEGKLGMGQLYLGAALLNHFEGLHVQNFDLPTIYADSTRSAETAIVQLFAEVKRHKPSVIYIPGIDTWYHTLSGSAMTTFLGLLRSIPPTDPILVLGISDTEPEHMNRDMLRDIFGFSKKNRFEIVRPSRENREEFFTSIIDYIKKAPKDFPDPINRKLRKLETLEVAPPPPPRQPTKEEVKALQKKDHMMLNLLKTLIQPIMDQIKKNKYRKFRNPVIPQHLIQYLLEEQDPDFVRPDIPQVRPYKLDKDREGVDGLRETETGKFFYNLEIVTIEERLSNGFYARPKDYLADIRTMAKDAKNIGDKERLIAANELVANVEVDLAMIEADPRLGDAENVYQRQIQRAKEKADKHLKRVQSETAMTTLVQSDIFPPGQESTTDGSGPVRLGEAIPGKRPPPIIAPYPPSSMSNGYVPGSQHSTEAMNVHREGRNGPSIHPHAGGEDVRMGGIDYGHAPSQTAMSSQMQPPHSQWGISRTSTGFNTQSQTSAFQQIPAETSPTALINDASTTTSGKKTSQSNPSSDGTQLTNGRHEFQYSPPEIPDTQRGSQELRASQEVMSGGTSSDEQWIHSQAHGIARGQLVATFPSQSPSSGSQGERQHASQLPPLFDSHPHPNLSRNISSTAPAGLSHVLNHPSADPIFSQSSSQKELIIDEEFMRTLLSNFTSLSSGCSIEQLEQINRELMDTLWNMRGNWNRTKVATSLFLVFEESIADIEGMQRVLQSSQDEMVGEL